MAGIVFGSAVAGSSYTWFQLALHTQWVEWLAWVPFMAIDVGGLYFGHNWITGRTTRVRVWGKATTLLMVAISVAGNGIEHAISGGFVAVSLWLNVSVGAIPAIAVFAVAHQWALKRHDATKTRRQADASPKRVTPRSTGVKSTAALSPPSEIGDRSQKRAAMVMWARRQPELPPLKRIQSEFRVSQSTAKRIRRDAVGASA